MVVLGHGVTYKDLKCPESTYPPALTSGSDILIWIGHLDLDRSFLTRNVENYRCWQSLVSAGLAERSRPQLLSNTLDRVTDPLRPYLRAAQLQQVARYKYPTFVERLHTRQFDLGDPLLLGFRWMTDTDGTHHDSQHGQFTKVP